MMLSGRSQSRRRWLAAGPAALLLLAACSGGGAAGVPEAAGTGSASTVPNFLVASGGNPAAGAGTPGTLPGSAAAPPAASGGAFCTDLADELAALPRLLGNATSAAQLGPALRLARQTNARLLRDAPAVIKSDVRTLVALSDRVLADVSTSPPNLADVPKVLADPAYQTASTNVTRYAAVHCGSLAPPTTAP